MTCRCATIRDRGTLCVTKGTSPYYSLGAYFKNTYGRKCYKVAVDVGCTCPNRDGKLDSRGCIFCSARGSGDFASPINMNSSDEDIRSYLDELLKDAEDMSRIIYFQAFTNTYGDIDRLRRIWEISLEHKSVIGISIATRPDCLGDEVLNVLDTLNTGYTALGKFIWVELGLQTIHQKTEIYIRRHYPLSVFDGACEKLGQINIPYIVHVIIGLPGETRQMMLETIDYVNSKHPFGIKLQLLHVLKDTDMAADYEAGLFETLSMEEYIDIVIDCVNHLDKNIVIHRITGDGPKNILIEPKWSGNKKMVLNTLHKSMKEKKCMQGKANNDSM